MITFFIFSFRPKSSAKISTLRKTSVILVTRQRVNARKLVNYKPEVDKVVALFQRGAKPTDTRRSLEHSHSLFVSI